MMKKLFILYPCLLGLYVCSHEARAQNKYDNSEGFVAHEWGTFTTLQQSNGNLLSGLELEEEQLPAFVQNLCFCYSVFEISPGKGYHPEYQTLKNVTVKMETPVLYFYSNEKSVKSVTVDVKFTNGSISQWYPARSAGELINDYYDYEPSLQILDFSKSRTGSIQWQATVLPKTENIPYTNKKADETPQWTAPRATASNLVKMSNVNIMPHPMGTEYQAGDQVEKFLFYRGIGNFTPPLKAEFNSYQNLVLTNTGSDNLSYVMVYEKTDEGKKRIWWSGKITGQSRKVVVKPLKEDSINVANQMEVFVKKLVSAGLYEDEARAMLNTWEKSYFEHVGLKIFWIVPPAFTDSTLPLTISPKPDQIKRVLIGRSEILTPAFEASLVNLPDSTFSRLYKNDRFLLAYKQLKSNGLPTTWTDYNNMTIDIADPMDATATTDVPEATDDALEIFPNPVTGNVVIKLTEIKNETALVKIVTGSGELIRSFEGKQGENSLDVSDWVTGTYIVSVNFTDGRKISKKLIKR